MSPSTAFVIQSQRRSLGGFDVGRVLPAPERRAIGPFVFFDHIGPVEFPPGIPQSVDVRPHPHIGLATITYLFAGEITHRDSLGFEQAILPGEVNWMTAGRGITHSERFETLRKHGGPLHGIQAWIALPHEHEETAPAFIHVGADQLPVVAQNGATIRVIAGDVFGHSSPVKTLSPLFYAHVDLAANTQVTMPAGFSECAAFIAEGSVNFAGEIRSAGQLLVCDNTESATFSTNAPATLMLLGGEPLGRRHIWWNFVSSHPERIEQAKADWRAHKFTAPKNDEQEWIPLPEEKK